MTSSLQSPHAIPHLTLIAAMDERRGIGVPGGHLGLPWHLPADLAHFRRETQGGSVVMGSTTFKAIGRALPGRWNGVLSMRGCEGEGIQVFASWKSLFEGWRQARPDDATLWVIGGGMLYEQALPHAQRLVLTRVATRVEGVQTFFPEWSPDEWALEREVLQEADAKNEFDMTFQWWKRRT